MDIIAAWAATVEAFTKVFSWQTGGRTRTENALRTEGEKWANEYKRALANGDIDRASMALSQLRDVRDKARSQRTGS